MRAQGRLISPLLEEDQPHRVLAVDMHVMRDAARLLAGAFDMLQAGAKHVVESILARQNAAGYENHAEPPSASTNRLPLESCWSLRVEADRSFVNATGAARQPIPPAIRRGCSPRTISSGPSGRR